MSVVLDANLLVALAVDDHRAPSVTALMRDWLSAGETLHAPALLPYEVANALTRLTASGEFPAQRLPDVWRDMMLIPITYHPVVEAGDRIVYIALRLQRKSAYDAAYIALAEEVGAELWTFDGPLARNAAALGIPVHLAR